MLGLQFSPEFFVLHSATQNRNTEMSQINKKLSSVALNPRANYTDRATAVCWRN
jgi:hypothetical protein